MARVEKELGEKQQELNEITERYDQAIEEKQSLENDLNICKDKIVTAQNLIQGLSGHSTFVNS